MLKRSNKIIASFFILSMAFSLLTFVKAEANTDKYNQKENYEESFVKGAKIYKDRPDSVNVLREGISDLEIKFFDGIADLSFLLAGNAQKYTLEIYPGSIAYGSGNASVIGVTDSVSYSYEIACFRIEKCADPITLMDANQSLAGKTVLYLGVSESGSDEVIYVQSEMADINFDNIFKMAENNMQSNSCSKELLNEIEFAYVYGTHMPSSNETTYAILSGSEEVAFNTNVKNNDINIDLLETLVDGNYNYGENGYYEKPILDENSTYSNSLFPAINDSIFKSVTSYGKWTHVKDQDQPYSYYQTYFAGTSNPSTKIIIFNWIHDYNSINGYRHSLSVAYNDTVLYSVPTGQLGCSTLETYPVTVTNIIIKSSINQSSPKNCFISFTQGETSSGVAYNLSSIVSIGVTVYGTTKTNKFWNTWSKIKSMATSSTATTIYYYGTPEKQIKYYEGGIVDNLSAEAKCKLKKKGDCINYSGATYIAYPNVNSEYSYSVSLQH